jgi:MFS family permease
MNTTAEAPPGAQPLPRNVKVLGGASLLNDIASEMIVPLLPIFLMEHLGGNRAHLGAIEGAADSASSILKLYSGGWSDRAGRRKGFVLVGYLLASLARPIIGLLAAPWQLFAARVADRTGKGIRTSPRDALIADSTEPGTRGWAFGFHRAMDHMGAAIGPLLALALWEWINFDLRTIFLLTLIPGLLAVALLVVGLKEPRAASTPTERLRLTLRPFDVNFKLYLVALLFFTLGNASDAFLLVRARELGWSQGTLLLLWSVFHVAKSSSNALFGRATDRVGPRQLLLLGWLTYAALYLAFAAATDDWHIWAFFVAYAVFYYGLTEPAEKTLAADLAGAERKGLAFGWFNLAIGIAAFPSSLLFGLIYEEWGALAAFTWGAGLALAAAALLVMVRPPPRTQTPA